MAYLSIPVAYVIAVVILFVTGRRRGLAVSLLFSALAVVVGLWAIMLSRSSTAAIGILFLPFAGVVAGALGWLFRNLQTSSRTAFRLLSWGCLVGACAVIAQEISQGMQTLALNQSRDNQQEARAARIEHNQARITALLAQNQGRESAVIDQLIRDSDNDPEMVLPALQSAFASPDTLDRFARKDDLSLTLAAVRNPNCRAETLARIYRTHVHPFYFYQALAAHPHTPPDILREMHGNPGVIAGLDIWFARNPATPADLLLGLTNTRDINVVQSLLQNPSLNCDLLGRTRAALARSSRPTDSYSTGRMAELDQALCATSPSQPPRIASQSWSQNDQ